MPGPLVQAATAKVQSAISQTAQQAQAQVQQIVVSTSVLTALLTALGIGVVVWVYNNRSR
jgi:hypothetical protein